MLEAVLLMRNGTSVELYACAFVFGAHQAAVKSLKCLLQALKSDDALSAMFGELSSRFPSLLQPLIHERDMVSEI